MPAPKGHKRYGGRAKGVVNRKTQTLIEKCEAKGVDVFELMLEYAIHPCEPALRFAALKELAQYVYPKRKALEVTGEVEHIIVHVHDYTSKKIEEK